MGDNFYITSEEYARADANGIHAAALEQRVRVYGWNIDRAASQPLRTQQDRSLWREIAEKNGITPDAFYRRINQYGWEIERAATEPLVDYIESLRRGSEAQRKYSPEWYALAAKHGISPALFRERVRDYGWDYRRAATEPKMSKSESGRLGKEALLKRVPYSTYLAR
ncbi:hypothetical protein NST50_05220 [Paenibacillus sp. FSL E2-0202]|uniref:hypothetical protein n=1 Tax=Paenibacillus sp. FSL E2-0202 TaxID=2954505 RepID=UPI0030EDF965